MADAERLHVAVVIPPFRRGSGGHSTIFNLLTRLEERGHTVIDLAPRPGRLPRGASGRRSSRGDLREYFRPIARPGVQGLRRTGTAPTSCSPRAGTPSTPCCGSTTAARAPTSSRTTSPSSSPPRPSRVCAERTYTPGSTASPPSPWLRDLLAAPLRRARQLVRPRRRPRRLPPAPGRAPRATRSSSTRATSRRGAAVPLGRAGAGRAPPPPPGHALRAVRRHQPIDRRSPTSTSASPRRRSCRGRTRRRRSGSSLSLTNYSLIPQEMMACGLPVRRARRATTSRACSAPTGRSSSRRADPVRARRRAGAAARRPGAVASAAPQAGLAFVARQTWDARRRAARGRAARRAARSRSRHAARAAGPAALAASRRASRRRGAEPRGVPIDRSATRRRPSASSRASMPRTWRRSRRGWTSADAATGTRVDEHTGARWRSCSASGTGCRRCSRRPGCGRRRRPRTSTRWPAGRWPPAARCTTPTCSATRCARVGADLDDVARGLDFGCSSGRVVRALAAAWPQAEWHGCDPNGEAIAWAREHLPGIAFLRSPQDPPLPYDDGDVRLRRARSRSGRTTASTRRSAGWRRCAGSSGPGGRLVITTHGLQSIAYYARTGERSPVQLGAIRRAMYRHGLLVRATSSARRATGASATRVGHGVLHARVARLQALPAWAIEDFAVGQNADNQDLYVLRRR